MGALPRWRGGSGSVELHQELSSARFQPLEELFNKGFGEV